MLSVQCGEKFSSGKPKGNPSLPIGVNVSEMLSKQLFRKGKCGHSNIRLKLPDSLVRNRTSVFRAKRKSSIAKTDTSVVFGVLL